jgi:hypothetical protein
LTVRDTYQASVVVAEAAKLATLQKAAMTQQEAINAVGVNIGANPMLGVTAAHDTIIKAANVTQQATAQKAEHDKQVAINNARSVLQAVGDVGPA